MEEVRRKRRLKDGKEGEPTKLLCLCSVFIFYKVTVRRRTRKGKKSGRQEEGNRRRGGREEESTKNLLNLPNLAQ